MRTLGLVVSLGLLTACGSVSTDADAPPGDTIDSAGGARDALSPSTPFEELSDGEIASICVQVRDPGCAELGGDACLPVCDACAEPDIVEQIRASCPGNTTVGDVTNCIATFAQPPGGETQFCDGPATCVVDALVLVCAE